MNACGECGFSLWLPVRRLTVSEWGLYSDARFPGRSLVKLDAHFDHLHDVPPALVSAFMEDLSIASKILMGLTGVMRVNVAILGNAVSHVHAHLIPRYSGEPHPDKSPWDDTRRKVTLTEAEVRGLLARLQTA